MSKFNYKETSVFFIYVFIALAFHYFGELTILKYTLKPFEVFFHEASHAFTALATQRELNSLALSWDGSGYVEHTGKKGDITSILTSFFGYFGAAFWGFLIYISALYRQRWIKIIILAFTLFFLLYAKDLTTMLILGYIAISMVIMWKIKTIGVYVLKFIGIFINISAIYSPTYLFSYSDSGDHISMFEKTFIPSFLWIAIWCFTSFIFLFISFKITINRKKNFAIKTEGEDSQM